MPGPAMGESTYKIIKMEPTDTKGLVEAAASLRLWRRSLAASSESSKWCLSSAE